MPVRLRFLQERFNNEKVRSLAPGREVKYKLVVSAGFGIPLFRIEMFHEQ